MGWPKTWRHAVPLLLLLMAGCIDGGADASRHQTYLADPDRDVLQAVDVAAFDGGAEPGIQAAPDGTLYAIAWKRMFTDDGRATWRELVTPFRQDGDSDLAIDRAGGLHVVAMGLTSEVSRGTPALGYWRSLDRGATWQLVHDLHPTGAIDRPWIAVAPDGRLVVTWNDFQAKRQGLRESRDGGTSWSEPEYARADWMPLVSRAVFHEEATWISMHNGPQVHLWHQASPQAPWQVLRGPPISPGNVFILPAVDGAGVLHLVGMQVQGGQRHVVHWTSRDGNTWGAPEVISTGLSGVLPWPVPLANGIAVAFYHATPQPDERLLPLQLLQPQDAPWQWHAVVAFPRDGAWQLVNTTTTAMHVGPMCLRFDPCAENAGPFFDYFEATALPDGRLAVAHIEHADQRGGSQHGLVVATT